MNAEQENRRNFSRIMCNGDALISRENECHSGRLLDLSLRGALVECSADWEPQKGQDYQLSIHLQDSETAINMECSLAHVANQKLGFTCTHIDIDSVSHLKRLIELNLADHNLLERELSALG